MPAPFLNVITPHRRPHFVGVVAIEKGTLQQATGKCNGKVEDQTGC
jgi:hypothetical protein